MSTIINILKAIGDFFSSVVDFVVKLFSDLVYVVKLLGETMAKLPQLLGFFPSSVLAVLLLALAVVVIYKVLGREG